MFIKTEIPKYTLLPNKTEILNQSIPKSLENEDQILKMKQESFKFFKTKPSMRSQDLKGRNKGLISTSEIHNNISSFLRKHYFTSSGLKVNDESLGLKLLSYTENRVELKPDSKLSDN